MKINTLLMATLLTVSGFICTSASAENFETSSLHLSWEAHRLSQGETASVSLDGWRYVEKLIIQAEGAGSYNGTFEVIVNGEVKGTVMVPGYDPSYIVTVKETTSSIELRQVSGGAIHIRDIKAVGYSGYQGRFDLGNSPLGLPARNQAMAITGRVIGIIDQLEPYSDNATYTNFFLPIKKASAHAYAKAAARGDLSMETRKKLVVLLAQIDAAMSVVNNFYERDALFTKALELQTQAELLRNLLN